MEWSAWVLGALFSAALLAAFDVSPASDLYSIDPKQLAELWMRAHVSPADPCLLAFVNGCPVDPAAPVCRGRFLGRPYSLGRQE